MLDDNLSNWSVEISAESHDDDVRKAFGKGHYTMAELEDTIVDALSHANCERFDLYFMTGIPKQTAASVRETGAYVQHLYERVNYDPRLVVLTSPMAPFLDVGSIAFDNPEKYGYRLRARTFEEHRERMILPSWKHIMNYESTYMSVDEMVDATYDAALDLNRIKGEHGILDAGMAAGVDARIRQAREQMNRLDDVLRNGTGPHRRAAGGAQGGVRAAVREHGGREVGAELGVRREAHPCEAPGEAVAFERARERAGEADREVAARGERLSPIPTRKAARSRPPGTPTARRTARSRAWPTDGMGDGRALADEDGAQVAAFGSVVAPGFSEANTNAASRAANAQLEAGRAGTAVGVGEAAAIRAEAAAHRGARPAAGADDGRGARARRAGRARRRGECRRSEREGGGARRTGLQGSRRTRRRTRCPQAGEAARPQAARMTAPKAAAASRHGRQARRYSGTA